MANTRLKSGIRWIPENELFERVCWAWAEEIKHGNKYKNTQSDFNKWLKNYNNLSRKS